MQKQLLQLQNGTDIRGIAIEYPGFDVNLTDENSKFITYGFVKWLEHRKSKDKINLKISVGMDSRLSGPKIKEAIINELVNLGCCVYDCGMCTTPAMFMTTVLNNYKCDGAIMITASHLPYYYNGLKFFTENGGCEKEDIREILNTASNSSQSNEKDKRNIHKTKFIEEYSNLLIDIIRQGICSKTNYNQPLSNFKIVVDAGNGAGGFFPHMVLKALGADITGSQFLEPDGKFPNHIPNPENKDAMNSIRQGVLDNHADLGIIFDADVDRAAVVDSTGSEINKNKLIALASSIVLEEHPNTTIVTDSVTSNGLGEFINNKLQGIHHRFKRGYKNVINEAIELNNKGKECYLAIETSGHAAFKENYFLDDGAYLISKILIKVAKLASENRSLQDLINNLSCPVESTEVRVKIKDNNFREYGSTVVKELKNYVELVDGWNEVANNYEGCRVSCDKMNGNGWYLLRLSLHEPVLCLNVESDSEGGVKGIIDKLIPFFDSYSRLDMSSLK